MKNLDHHANIADNKHLIDLRQNHNKLNLRHNQFDCHKYHILRTYLFYNRKKKIAQNMLLFCHIPLSYHKKTHLPIHHKLLSQMIICKKHLYYHMQCQ